MPTSHHRQLNELIEIIVLVDPRSVLDVGVGFGKFGVLAREYLELWDGRERYDVWERRIDGIEGCEGYITDLHRFVYDHVYVGDALQLVDELECRYDLVLLIDVLEHFEREAGMALLEKLLSRGRSVLLSTPIEMPDQESSFGNVYETHRYEWQPADFEAFSPRLEAPNPESHIVLLGEDVERVRLHLDLARTKRLRERHPLLRPILKPRRRRLKRRLRAIERP